MNDMGEKESFILIDIIQTAIAQKVWLHEAKQYLLFKVSYLRKNTVVPGKYN